MNQQQIEALVAKAAESRASEWTVHNQVAKDSFIAGANFLLPVLIKAIEQRDRASNIANDISVYIPFLNQELITLLEAK